MKKTALALLIITLLATIAFAAVSDAEQEKPCKNALITLDFTGAYDCYRDLGDKRLVQATNALGTGDYNKAITLGNDAIRLKSGFGLCTKYFMCGGAAHASTLVSVAYEKKGQKGQASSYAKRAITYAKNSGQCEGSAIDEEANAFCAIQYYTSVASKYREAKLFNAPAECKLLMGSTNPDHLDVVFVGSNFANDTPFNDYVDKTYRGLFTVQPFARNSGKFNIWRLDTRQDLSCVTKEPRIFECDRNKITAAASTCPNDVIVVVVNNNEWRGAGFKNENLVYLGMGVPTDAFVHELGHAFAGLDDEYLYEGTDPYQPEESPNCDTVAVCPKFAGTSTAECKNGCGFANRYRSIDTGMMRILGHPFGPFDEKIIEQKLSRYK